MAPARARARDSVFDAIALRSWLASTLASERRGGKHALEILKHCAAFASRADVDANASLRDIEWPRSTLANDVRVSIADRFELRTTRVASTSTSRDGRTTKLLIALQDGHSIETCVMRHARGRVTVCVSSQVGCRMGCTFCATGTLGELGNLTVGEMCEQVAHANAVLGVGNMRCRNVVFMGMGEPLNNYDAVIGACEVMRSAFGLAASKITVSTVGVIPKMLTLARDAPGTGLALSLHAPTQELRQTIVPTATAYKLNDLMRALDEYLASAPKMKAMIEYCVLGGVNDDETCAEQLGELLRGKEVILNLIPFNPTDTPAGHVPPKPEVVQAMVKILTKKYDIFTTVRHTMGDDIDGACGQLALKGHVESDIEDLMSVQKVKVKSTKTTAAKSTAVDTPSISSPMESRAKWKLGASPTECALLGVSVASAALLMFSIFLRRARRDAS